MPPSPSPSLPPSLPPLPQRTWCLFKKPGESCICSAVRGSLTALMPLVLASFGERWHLAAVRHIHQVAAGAPWHQSRSRPVTEVWAALSLAREHLSLQQQQKSTAGHLGFIVMSVLPYKFWLNDFCRCISKSLPLLNSHFSHCKTGIKHTYTSLI